MRHLRANLENPKGQVLLATLLFCFIFAVLFAGLYKAGMVYSLKERANRAGELTAISGGAVYANGLQLVRLTNVLLIAFAIIDLTVIAAEVTAASTLSFGALAGVAIKADPHFRKKVQDLQKILFGINIPLPGLYPALIFTESLSINEKNNLMNNWFQGGPSSFQMPIPPYPLFLFNSETTSPVFLSAIPSMALKFRTADQFIQDMENPKNQKVYRYQDKNGEYHYFEEKDTEVANGSMHSGQRRSKEGNKLLELNPVIVNEGEEKAQNAAEGKLIKSGAKNIESVFGAIAPLLNGIQMDVTDRDDPPNHTFIAYTNLPTRLSKTTGSNNQIQSVSEVSVEGPGLAAWDLTKPLYQSRRVNLDPTRLTELLISENTLQGLVNSGKIPSVTNLFNPSALLDNL